MKYKILILFLFVFSCNLFSQGESINTEGGKTCTSCDGLCPFVGIAFTDNAGVLEYTMDDGTLISMPNSANISNFWPNGSIEILNATIGIDEVVISFSNPVNIQIAPAVQPTTRVNWHEANATTRSRFETNGSDWTLEVGTQPANITLNGSFADTQVGETSGVDANDDWGLLESCGVTELRVASNVYDLWNFNVQSTNPTCCKDVCEVIEELRKDIANNGGGGTDLNTTYQFGFDCDDGGLNVEVTSSDGNSDYSEIVDLSCHITNVMQNTIDELEEHIDDDEVLNCVDVVNCLPADLQDGDDDTQLTESQVDAFVANNGYFDDCADLTGCGFLTSEVDGDVTNECNTGLSVSTTGLITLTDACGDQTAQIIFEESPWDDLATNNAANQSSTNIQYTDGNVTIGNSGSIIGTQSDFQSLSDEAGNPFLQVPWVYTNAIEAIDEKGNISTAIILGEDDNYNQDTDHITMVTNGQARLTVEDNGLITLNDYGSGTNTGTATFDLCVDANGTIIEQPKVDNVNDADADPTNEIQNIQENGSIVSLTNSTAFIDVCDIVENNCSLDDADADPTNEIQTLNQNFGNILVPLGFANVQGNGTVVNQNGGVAVNRTGTGQYTITPPAGALTSVFQVIEAEATRDDIQLSKENFVGTQIHITEQDNGGTAGVYRDRDFTVIFYGADSRLLNVTISN